MGTLRNVLKLSLPQRIQLVDYIRGQLALTKSGPLGTMDAFCEEIKQTLGFEVNKNILKSTCDALEIRLDDIIEREFDKGSPVSLLHIRVNKLEKLVNELKEKIDVLERDNTMKGLI